MTRRWWHDHVTENRVGIHKIFKRLRNEIRGHMMDQLTAANGWAHLDPGYQERVLEYRQRVVDAIMAVASRHGATVDWGSTDIENHIISFKADPADREAFSHDLATLLGGIEE